MNNKPKTQQTASSNKKGNMSDNKKKDTKKPCDTKNDQKKKSVKKDDDKTKTKKNDKYSNAGKLPRTQFVEVPELPLLS